VEKDARLTTSHLVVVLSYLGPVKMAMLLNGSHQIDLGTKNKNDFT